MRRLVLSLCAAFALFPHLSLAQATQPADDAAALYLKAADLVGAQYDLNIMSPSASNLEYPAYPPFSDEWQKMEKADFSANTPARVLAHQARSMTHADWPPHKGANGVMYLNRCRALANELGDAALYQHLQGDDSAAFETIDDLLHLADLLDDQPGQTLVRYLVGIGIRAMAVDRLAVIASSVAITKDPANTKDLQVASLTDLMNRLPVTTDAQSQVGKVEQTEGPGHALAKPDLDRLIETVKRVNSECNMTTLSLACHVYRFQNGHWPTSLEDLHEVCPNIPVDPFSVGKQTLGYALVRNGLPDGSDRPLVYSRYHATDGLFYRVDHPNYGFYNDDGSNRPIGKQRDGGQFRDVASWVPAPGQGPSPTTQPLN